MQWYTMLALPLSGFEFFLFVFFKSFIYPELTLAHASFLVYPALHLDMLYISDFCNKHIEVTIEVFGVDIEHMRL